MKTDFLGSVSDRLTNQEGQIVLQRLMPLIVPSQYFDGDHLPSPHVVLPCETFSLTAVIPGEDHTMLFLSEEDASAWKEQGIDWVTIAKDNVRQTSDGNPFTHTKQSEDGRILCGFMMQEDGFGSSRVLCSEALRTIFPEGYRVAIPERSLGIAISKAVTPAEYEEIAAEVVQECYRIGSVPNTPEIFEPEALGG